MNHDLDDLMEAGTKRRFTVATQSHRFQEQKLLRHFLIPGQFVHASFHRKGQHLTKLASQRLEIHPALARGSVSPYLAVDAVERAELIGRKIDADGESARALRDHGINEAVIEEPARTAERVGRRAHWDT